MEKKRKAPTDSRPLNADTETGGDAINGRTAGAVSRAEGQRGVFRYMSREWWHKPEKKCPGVAEPMITSFDGHYNKNYLK